MTRPDRATFPIAGLVAGILVFTWPQLSAWIPGAPTWYPLVTALFTLFVVAIVLTWPRADSAPGVGNRPVRPVALIVTVVGAAIVVGAAYRWTRLLAWQPYQADMLIVVREATRRFLSGRMPYTTYRTYDAPWNIAMPYGPGLWGPYLIPQLLRLDFRFLTIVGELFVPVWCGVVAAVESARGHAGRATAWLAVLAALVFCFDVQGFTLIGHTPVYWPLLPLFAAAAARQRWAQAACLLGALALARTTMVAVIPVFLMAAWTADRRRFALVLVCLLVTIAAVLVPFVIWDYRGVWDNMVLSYPRVMKESVWPVLARNGIETIGLTEWLVEQHREAIVVPAQILVMVGVYGATWRALRQGAVALPWMALALFAFSMTSLYPVHYLYYDVLLLLVSGAIVGTLGSDAVRVTAMPWLVSLTALIVLMLAMAQGLLSPFPRIEPGGDAAAALRSGFAMSESDGQRRYSWIVGHDATIVLPRRSADPAVIVLSVRSAVDNTDAPQSVTAILNGTVLGHTAVPAGWRDIRFTAPRSTWWVGFNQLHLVLSSTVSPRAVGAGDDPRELALALSRIEVTPQPD